MTPASPLQSAPSGAPGPLGPGPVGPGTVGPGRLGPGRLGPGPLGLDLLWEIPLALLSWGFFHLNKAVIARLYQGHLDRQVERSRCWQVFSAESLRRPLSLPVLLTKGPRWNTHATIGTVGPLAVRQQLAVDTGEAHRSAEAWSVVVYRYPDFATFRELGSLDTPAGEGPTVVRLPAGRYVLGVRYYGLRSQPRLPALWLDGAETELVMEVEKEVEKEPEKGSLEGAETTAVVDAAVASEPLPRDANRVYDNLAERSNLYFRALHHYVHTMLRLRAWLPADRVRREFLPVGDPFTTFRYGWFPAGSRLEVVCAERLLRDYRVLLSVYNRASLPVHSCALEETISTTPQLSQAGFYLFRLRPRRLGLPACAEEELVIRCLGPLA